MGDIVNLRRFRKAKARADDDRQAQTNRRLHGATKAERVTTQAEREKLRRHVDGHRLAEDEAGAAPDDNAT